MRRSGSAGAVRRRVLTCAAVVGAAMAVEAASASIILEPGRYRINNHPDGGEKPPAYGLRLDGLIDVPSDENDIFTFDFDADGSDVWLNLSADGTIRISGEVYGGLDRGDDYDPAYSGLWFIDFTYAASEAAPGDDDIIVDEPDEPNTGTITQMFGSMESWDLFDHAGEHPYTFRLGNEDDDEGHRGFDGISGWGWLNYDDPDTHVKSSDWIFTLTIPAPPTLPLLAALALTGRRRRRT